MDTGQFSAAVIIPTILRPSLLRAVRSVFNQDIHGSIQVLIGIDHRQGESEILNRIIEECPDHISLMIFDPGYSTSVRHGGIYSNQYSGAIRTILSYSANSRYVAYLDDDDWWRHDHLSSLLAIIDGRDWAFSYRWLVDQETGWPICPDEWDSLGPGKGINQERFGGFVSPSNMMFDKEACHFVLPYWSLSPFKDGTGEDRLVFRELLKEHPWASSGKYSCYYEMPGEVQRHAHHAREFAKRNIRWIFDREQIKTISVSTDQAAAMLSVGAFDKAIKACQDALAVNQYHALSLYSLAVAEWLTEDRTSALAHIEQAREVNDSDARILAAAEAMTSGAFDFSKINFENSSPVSSCMKQNSPYPSV